ncbi:MAG: DUF3592 domain-containing protein [Roseinatronobacter sp.]
MTGKPFARYTSRMERKPVRLWHLIRRLGLLWVAVPLIMGIIFTLVGANILARANLLAREGVETVGTVLTKRIQRESTRDGERLTYFLRYSYLPEGGLDPISRETSVSQTFYTAAEIGSPVRVVYAWSEPDQSSLDPSQDRIGGWIFLSFGTAALLGSLGFGGWIIGRKLSILRALRHGEVREARVLGLRATNVSKGKATQYILDWVDAAGQSGSSMMASHGKLAAYPVGAVIVVYIDPKTGRGWWDVQI